MEGLNFFKCFDLNWIRWISKIKSNVKKSILTLTFQKKYVNINDNETGPCANSSISQACVWKVAKLNKLSISYGSFLDFDRD